MARAAVLASSLLLVFAFVSLCHSSPNNNSVLIIDGINRFSVSFKDYDTTESKYERDYDRLVVIAKNATVHFVITDLPFSISFLIVQIHTYQYNLTMSYEDTFPPKLRVFGTNLGLVINNNEKNTANVYLRNDNAIDVQALFAIVAYPNSAPIPGGCNMEFDTEIAPYQRLRLSESSVTVDMQPAAAPNSNPDKALCETNDVRHEVYRFYLPEQDFTSDTYFSAIRKTLTVEGIRANGKKIPAPVTGSKMRRVYSAYPGTGSVFAAIAVMGDERAAYVSTFTYACSPLSEADTCQVLTSPFSKVVCAAVFFLGLFAAFLGHKYFKTQMFLLGFLSGGLLSYVVISLVNDYGPSGNIAASVFVGCLLGIAWLGVWWLYAIPMLPILLATLTLGFFNASIAYFSSPAGISYLENDTNFWLTFLLVMLCVPLVLSVVPDSANIVCCAILGSYAAVISVDHYAGSNLKYIIINVVRRATSTGFNLAVICPPYQVADICLTCCWLILAVAGVYVQLKRNRGKPPFPPGMQSNLGILSSSERTPLLNDAVRARATRLGNLQNDVEFTSAESQSTNYRFCRNVRGSSLFSCLYGGGNSGRRNFSSAFDRR